MKFRQSTAELFIPNGVASEEALRRTTHLAIGAHQDDIEIMAVEPILRCFQQSHLWFSAVVLSDGRGSPRDDLYSVYSDEEMRVVRFKEQKKAAVVGEYTAQGLLDYPSKAIKDAKDKRPVEDLMLLFNAMSPQFVYTHNLADKHDTHVATALRVIEALRRLPPAERPEKLYGCEVWRSLDWLLDSDKVSFNLSSHENLQAALLGVFDSQICGGKRYDLASMGRRRANATYFESHGVDATTGLSYAMDMSLLMSDATKDPVVFAQDFIQRFEQDINDRIRRMS
ncbi:MAG: PIG-L deacetylase family protein [Anaerolineales bacterium]